MLQTMNPGHMLLTSLHKKLLRTIDYVTSLFVRWYLKFTTYMSGHCVALGNLQILELRHPNVQMELFLNGWEI